MLCCCFFAASVPFFFEAQCESDCEHGAEKKEALENGSKDLFGGSTNDRIFKFFFSLSRRYTKVLSELSGSASRAIFVLFHSPSTHARKDRQTSSAAAASPTPAGSP